ncbi:protein DEK [Eutrema salsugineum]|uniref:protein DEK n=1 Tax=Eutrema salsugineum TaxID=72664 RepID=UPI000CECEBF5|nr:protein DEK [Eutrema salsugineum]
MATETLEEKLPEADSPLKEEDAVADSEMGTEKKETPVSDGKEDEVKDEDMEEKGEEDDGGNKEEKTGERDNSSEKEPVTPVSGRPTRMRKKVERYILPTPSRSSGSKPVSIEQGRGTRLREIPNVAYKLSKRKPDDNLFLLHTILYGKKGKAQMLKRNIGQFSGFVWSEEEEEKQRAKAKEKLEKCIKEKLIDFCDVLDIPINKSNVKKEELAVRVLEFLECPKVTRDIVLADSEKETKKRKKSTPKNVTSGESSDVPAKKRRQTKESGTEEGNDKGDADSEGTNDSSGEDDAAPEKENDKSEDTETEDEKDKTEEKKATDKKSSSKRTKKEKPSPEEEKSLKGSEKSGGKFSKQVDKSASSSSKKQKVEKDDSSKEKGKKQKSKPQAKGSKDQGTRKASKKGKAEPTREELHVVVAKILKEVDFNTATLSDILRKLGSHFGVDLMHRKTEVKDIITDAINEMSDDDEREENTEDEGEKEKEDQEKKD